MPSYLKQAFWASAEVPGLGRLPVNALALCGFALLGLVHPLFWVAGAALEVGFLALLSSDRRFRRWVDAAGRLAADREEPAPDPVAAIQPAARERLRRFEEKSAHVLRLQREAGADELATDGTAAALAQLTRAYLRLLTARDRLQASRVQAAREKNLPGRIAELERELGSPGLSPSLRASREATLQILCQRLANLARIDRRTAEVDGDLERLEAQVDLALENARLQGHWELAPVEIEWAGRLLDDELGGEAVERENVGADRASGAGEVVKHVQ